MPILKSLHLALCYLGFFASRVIPQSLSGIIAVKRTAPFSLAGIEELNSKRQTEVDGCAFHANSDEPTAIPVNPIQLRPSIGCGSDAGCELATRHQISLSYSQTGEVGKESGATILEVVQVSVSFSNLRAYTEETSTSVPYAMSLDRGQGRYTR